jgi:hypothetical protein
MSIELYIFVTHLITFPKLTREVHDAVFSKKLAKTKLLIWTGEIFFQCNGDNWMINKKKKKISDI